MFSNNILNNITEVGQWKAIKSFLIDRLLLDVFPVQSGYLHKFFHKTMYGSGYTYFENDVSRCVKPQNKE
jgi:hypothetical protein